MGKLVVEIVNGGSAETEIESDWDADCCGEPESATWTANPYEPAVVGVPASAPLAASDRPGGSWPEMMLQV